MKIEVYARSIDWETEKITDTPYGIVTDVLAATVTREQNGGFSLDLQAVANANNMNRLKIGRCLRCKARPTTDATDLWTFVIDNIDYTLDQRVHVMASHPSARLQYVPVAPFKASKSYLEPEINKILSRTVANGGRCLIPHGLKIGVNYENKDFDYERPFQSKSIRPLINCIYGQAGSLADTLNKTMYISVVSDDTVAIGPEPYSHASVSEYFGLYTPAGRLHNPIRYGVNMAKYSREISADSTPHGAAAFWQSSGDADSVYYNGVVWPGNNRSRYYLPRIDVKDFSSQFETAPTADQLKAAVSGISAGIDEYIEVEVASYEPARLDGYTEVVTLGNTIPVIYPQYGLNEDMRVVKLVYDVLLDDYVKIGLGSLRRTLPATLADAARKIGIAY